MNETIVVRGGRRTGGRLDDNPAAKAAGEGWALLLGKPGQAD